MIRKILPVAMLAALAACDSDPVPAAAEQGANAEGDVLEGSISDEMLPLESVTSSAPPAERSSEDSEDAENSPE